MNTSSSIAATRQLIEVTQTLILTKLINHQLKPQRIFSKLTVDITQLKTMLEKPTLNRLTARLGAWQTGNNIATFTQNINELILLWTDALQQGASLQDVINVLRCFEIKSFTISNTAKFHCFILELLAETSLQQQDLTLNNLLNYDADTQLPNANQILTSMEKVVSVTPTNQHIGVFSIQLQLSKNNPIFTISVAANLNRAVAEVLQGNMPTGSQIHANGNLQFDILLPNISSEIKLNLLAAKLQRAFEQMLNVENQFALMTLYIGCAYALKPKTHAEDLLASARLALGSAISTQQPFLVYSDALKIQLLTQNELEKKVLETFSNDGLTMFFQPIIDLKDSRCVGAELLLRISAESNFSIYPSLIVEILNRMGRGQLFTRWLINSACRFAAELKYQHQLNFYLTVNLRAEDLYDFELPHLFLQAVALWKISPNDLVLEVTENGVLELNETSNSVIKELAKNGFKLALDDFGTGFSSLSRLRNMPIDIIKIDQSFVRDITHSKNDYEIVKSIAALANSLGKEVIAEGVEDLKCLELIHKMKIHKCQGYYFAKPMPFDEFVVWQKKRH
jgi:EAL domain-containing protein (putative c-di-GMP-specific phosphodiesterase class I)/GGDEF domain-containing protein